MSIPWPQPQANLLLLKEIKRPWRTAKIFGMDGILLTLRKPWPLPCKKPWKCLERTIMGFQCQVPKIIQMKLINYRYIFLIFISFFSFYFFLPLSCLVNLWSKMTDRFSQMCVFIHTFYIFMAFIYIIITRSRVYLGSCQEQHKTGLQCWLEVHPGDGPKTWLEID